MRDMWFMMINLTCSKMVWIFLFVVFCITSFLLLQYSSQKDELRKYILLDNKKPAGTNFLAEARESIDEKLHSLAQNLTEKERTLKRSEYEIKSAERALTDIDDKTLSSRDRYKALMIDLRRDVNKTEEEVKSLQKHVSHLAMRRETLKHEVTKQQEDYQKMLVNFAKQLDSSLDVLPYSTTGKSRYPFGSGPSVHFQTRFS